MKKSLGFLVLLCLMCLMSATALAAYPQDATKTTLPAFDMPSSVIAGGELEIGLATGSLPAGTTMVKAEITTATEEVVASAMGSVPLAFRMWPEGMEAGEYTLTVWATDAEETLVSPPDTRPLTVEASERPSMLPVTLTQEDAAITDTLYAGYPLTISVPDAGFNDAVAWEIVYNGTSVESGMAEGRTATLPITDNTRMHTAHLRVAIRTIDLWSAPAEYDFEVSSQPLPEQEETPKVRIEPETPNSSDDVLFFFDRQYSWVKFTFYRSGIRESSYADALGEDCCFDVGWVPAGEYTAEFTLTLDDGSVEETSLAFTVEQAPLIAPPVLVSCPSSVTMGEQFTVEYTEDEHASGLDLCLLDGRGETLGFNNPQETGRVIFSDWPDSMEPGTYTLRMRSWAMPGYDAANSSTQWTVQVTDGERPAPPEDFHLRVEGNEVTTLPQEGPVEIVIEAPGAEAVRWKTDFLSWRNDTDHSGPVEVDEDGCGTSTLWSGNSGLPEAEISVYALRGGIWSEPLRRRVLFEGAAFEGTVDLALNRPSPTDEDYISLIPGDGCDRFYGTLRRGDTVVSRVNVYGAGESAYLGQLQPGQYTVTGRGRVGGVWSEEVTLAFAVSETEKLDAPEILECPSEVRVGEAFTVRLTPDSRADYSTITLYDSEGRSVAFNNNAGGDRTAITPIWWQGAPQPGTYRMELRSYSQSTGMSSPAVSRTISVVEGERPILPMFDVESETVSQGEPIRMTFDRVYDWICVEIYVDGDQYTWTDVKNTDSFIWDNTDTVGTWQMEAAACIDGVWTEWISRDVVVGPGETLDSPVLVRYPAEIQVGENFEVEISQPEDADYTTMYLYDGSNRYVGFNNLGRGETVMSFCRWEDDSAPGTYRLEIISYRRSPRLRSEPVEVTISVTDGVRPDAPGVTLEPEKVSQGAPVQVVFDQVYDMVCVETYYEGSRYSGVESRNTDRYTWSWTNQAGSWTVKAAACVSGVWSPWTSMDVVVEEQVIEPHVPDSVTAGMPVSVTFERMDGIYYYGARILDSQGRIVDENGSSTYGHEEDAPSEFLLCTRGSTSLEAGTYTLSGWVTGSSSTRYGDDITITVTGTRPEAPQIQAADTARLGEPFPVSLLADGAENYEIRVLGEGETEPVLSGLAAAGEWTVDFPHSGTYTVEGWALVGGQWSLRADVSVQAQSDGQLPPPEVSGAAGFPEGENPVFAVSCEGAESFSYTLVMGGRSWQNMSGRIAAGSSLVLDMKDNPNFGPGGYNLTVRSEKAGWDSGETEYVFTIGDAPAAPEVTVSKNRVAVGEQFTISFASEADASFHCDIQYDPSDAGSIGGFSSEKSSGTWTWDFAFPGKHFIRAWAEKDGVYSAYTTVYVDAAEDSGEEVAPPEMELTLYNSPDGLHMPVGNGFSVTVHLEERDAEALEVREYTSDVIEEDGGLVLASPSDSLEDILYEGTFEIGVVPRHAGTWVFRARVKEHGVWSDWAEKRCILTSVGTLDDPEIRFEHDFLYEGEALRGQILNYDPEVEYLIELLTEEYSVVGYTDTFGPDGSFTVTSEGADEESGRRGEGFAAMAELRVLVSALREGYENGWMSDDYTAMPVRALPEAANTLTLPGGTRRVEEAAFEGMAADRAVLPEGCEAVEDRAFAACPSLRVVEIPGARTQVSAEAFAGSPLEVLITPAGSLAEGAVGEQVHVIHLP